MTVKSVIKAMARMEKSAAFKHRVSAEFCRDRGDFSYLNRQLANEAVELACRASRDSMPVCDDINTRDGVVERVDEFWKGDNH